VQVQLVIAMQIRFFGAPIQLRVVYALIASLLWWAMVESEEQTGLPFYGTGAVFAALVLVPFLPNFEGANKLRALALLLCGMLSYWSAVNLAGLDALGAFAMGLAGVCGALVVGIGARLFVPLVLRWDGWLMLAGAGLLGGVVLQLGFDAGLGMWTRHYEYWLPGHLTWEVLVCLALYYGSTLKGSMAGPATAPE
jgi:hypothetical protein